mmetsp:Transcript_44785/g.80500  ORF Transcript_44785/g.80500 Transcript_44785/m.80500 type:complete len:145 (+) Transcript_44785:117-551(+)
MNNPNLFSVKIDNLKYDWDDFISARNEIKDTFAKFGEVIDCHLPKERSFGFVRYESEREAEDAIAEMDGKDMFGDAISCSLATKPKRDAAEMAKRGGGGRGGRSRSRGRRRRDDSRDRRSYSRSRDRRRGRDDSRSESRPRRRR